MTPAFLNQHETAEYLRTIANPEERLLVTLASGNAVSFFVRDPRANEIIAAQPFDLLLYTRAIHHFLKQKSLIQKVFSGEIQSVDDVDIF